jgi:hypothetical protein
LSQMLIIYWATSAKHLEQLFYNKVLPVFRFFDLRSFNFCDSVIAPAFTPAQ